MSKFYKGFLLTLVTLSLALVVGCGGGDPGAVDSTALRTFQGELSELPTTIRGLDVTHVLVTEAKERVYLRSILFDLESYVGDEVRVVGGYNEDEVAGSPVDVLTVEKVDVLVDSESGDTEPDQIVDESKFGLRFGYSSELFTEQTTSSRITLSSREDQGVITIKVFKKSPEMDAEVFEDLNYAALSFSDAIVGVDSVTARRAESSAGKIVYILLRNGYFYEVLLTNADLSTRQQEAFENMLSTFEYVAIDEDPEDEEEEEDSDDDEEADEDDSDEEPEEDDADTEAPATSTDSSFAPVIAAFENQASSLLTGYNGAISYAFTDNGYFYVVYTSGSSERRSLFSYTDSNAFSQTATFVPGTTQDWDLASGDNVAFSRPLTLIIVGSSGATEVSLEQGFRYFESLPLEFGMQYPMNWYYQRSGDKYQFSDKPIGTGNILVGVTVTDDSFSSSPGSNITSKVKKSVSGSTVSFYVDLGDSVVAISGVSDYEGQMNTMATTMNKVESN